ncbi:ATP-binding protein [Oligoflexus tunisiensis]|uniref:ATP-binding protein n=1 Tax=Oligoflexus tunisiensis TaxID=708132 RepID=UPI000AF89305|nr:ATP-binding protein [Oligoflexus tunisiensis]
MYRRQTIEIIKKRLNEDRKFIQILLGPRQVGKTTLVMQLEENNEIPQLYASADDAQTRDRIWLETQWQRGRVLAKNRGKAVLVIDEIQKVSDWSDSVKALWDADTRNKTPLHVLLLGSTPLFAARGITESLAGRYETIYASHWSYQEMADAFAYSLDEYFYFGGYPGAAHLRKEPQRWRHYVKESIIEATVSRDLLATVRIDKPALLRNLFFLACNYGGRILSYTKMLGQLNDAGNTTTLAHYLDLLSQCGLVCGLQKFSGESVRSRGSSPKLLTLDPSLLTAIDEREASDWLEDPESKGHLVENVIGSHLWRVSREKGQLFYWSEGKWELDFVYTLGRSILAIEVKSGRRQRSVSGLAEFKKRNPDCRTLIVGMGGVPLEDFLRTSPEDWF